eukprot:s699_g27.t2
MPTDFAVSRASEELKEVCAVWAESRQTAKFARVSARNHQLLSLSGWLLGASFVTTSPSASVNVRPVRRDALAGSASAVASHAKQKRWQQASAIIANLSPRRLQLDVSISNALVSAIGKASKWLRALCAFSAMRRSRLDHDHISFNSAISACGRGGAWKQSAHLSAMLRTEDLSHDVVTFNAGISACEIQARWPMALAILHDACNGVKLHLVTFGAMLTTARRAAAWEVTLAALMEMRPRSLYPNEVCGNAAIAALRTQSAKWADARSLLMVEPGASSTSLVLSSLVGAWREVFQLLSQWGDGSLTVPTLNAGITACHRGNRWEMSLWILSKMCSCGPRPDAITCASTLAGCERGQRWQFVEQLLRAFRRRSTQLDLTVNQAALSAAAKGHAWRSATQGIHEATQEGFPLSAAAMNTAAFACQSGKRWRWSAELTGQLRLATVRPDRFSATSLLASAWPTALHALQGFNLLMLKYDDLACSSIMTTLSCSKIWDRALLLQQQLPTNVGDALACDVLTSACETSRGLEPLPALLVQAASVLRWLKSRQRLKRRQGMVLACCHCMWHRVCWSINMDSGSIIPWQSLSLLRSRMPEDLNPAPHRDPAPEEATVLVELRTTTQQELWGACMEGTSDPGTTCRRLRRGDFRRAVSRGRLREKEQKKITEALAKVETKAEAAAAPATGETPSTEAKPEEKKAEEPEMSDEQLSMLKAAFDDIDTNGSKYIEAAELKTVLGKMKVELSDDQIDAVFKRADLNKDGKLSFDEYKKLVCAGMQDPTKTATVQWCPDGFQRFQSLADAVRPMQWPCDSSERRCEHGPRASPLPSLSGSGCERFTSWSRRCRAWQRVRMRKATIPPLSASCTVSCCSCNKQIPWNLRSLRTLCGALPGRQPQTEQQPVRSTSSITSSFLHMLT